MAVKVPSPNHWMTWEFPKGRNLEVMENVMALFYQREGMQLLLFLAGCPVSHSPISILPGRWDPGIAGSYWCREFLHSLHRVPEGASCQ